jgi:hypothetical protein
MAEPKKPKRPRDVTQIAHRIVQEATGEVEREDPDAGKDPKAIERGRAGGEKRAAKMTPEQRSQAAREAVKTRWAKAEAGEEE